MAERLTTFDEFWLDYLRAHSHRQSRLLHYVGASASLVMFLFAVVVSPWLLLAVPAVGYIPAWLGHWLIEKNRPSMFSHSTSWVRAVGWSALAGCQMYRLAVTGRLSGELARAGDDVEGTAGRHDRWPPDCTKANPSPKPPLRPKPPTR